LVLAKGRIALGLQAVDLGLEHGHLDDELAHDDLQVLVGRHGTGTAMSMATGTMTGGAGGPAGVHCASKGKLYFSPAVFMVTLAL
jgi:hypothetical protein